MQPTAQLKSTTIEYLHRLDLEASEPKFELLKNVIKKHVSHLSFCSVGPMLRDELPLDISAISKRILHQNRGGYCFEQNKICFAALEDLGFKIVIILARVIYNLDHHPGLTHRFSIINIDHADYLIDVCFGSDGPSLPVPLNGTSVMDNFREFRVWEKSPGTYHLQTIIDNAYFSLYRFERSEYGESDCDLGHFYSHKHPTANFVNHLVVTRIFEDEIRSLKYLTYRTIIADGFTDTKIPSAKRLLEVLHTDFDISISHTESQLLFEKISQAHLP